MHVWVSAAGNRIDFVDEDDDFTQLFAVLPEFGKSFLTLSVVLAHNCLDGHIDQRNIDLLSNDFGTGCFSCPRRSFEQHGFWSILLKFDSCSFSDLIIDLWIIQCQQDCIFDWSLLAFVPGQVIPIQIVGLVFRVKNSNAKLLELFVKLVLWFLLLLLGLRTPMHWRNCRNWGFVVSFLGFNGMRIYTSQECNVLWGNCVMLLKEKPERGSFAGLWPRNRDSSSLRRYDNGEKLLLNLGSCYSKSMYRVTIPFSFIALVSIILNPFSFLYSLRQLVKSMNMSVFRWSI